MSSGGRGNKGFHPPALEAWVNTAKELSDPNKKIAALLLPFTGLRVDEFCHIHGPTWFSWIDAETGETNDRKQPKLKVPGQARCHIGGDTSPCPSCQPDDRFTTKYDDERQIPLAETWENNNRGKQGESVTERLDLPKLCRNYFKVTEDDVGKEMVGPKGNGVTAATVNRWLKEVGQKAQIGYERGLTESAHFDEPVPDVIPHDMRGTFIMQLIRNNMQRTKLVIFTGHDHVSSLAPYEERVYQEEAAQDFLACL